MDGEGDGAQGLEEQAAAAAEAARELRDAAAALAARRAADEDALRRRAVALDADVRRLQDSVAPLDPSTLDKVEEELERARAAILDSDVAAFLPSKGNGKFLKKFVGPVNVRVARKEDKLKVKDEYNNYRDRAAYMFLLFPSTLLLLRWWVWDGCLPALAVQVYQAWLLFLYTSFALRENVLLVNGSDIRPWWIYHHYLAMLMALVSLTWEIKGQPDCSSKQRGVQLFLRWAIMQGIAMHLQNRYQRQRLRTRIALGKAKRMDVVAGETAGVDAAAAAAAESDGTAEKRARSGDCDDTADDFISSLPDAVLGTIISLLPTKDGGRTPALSRRWRHLWRSAPLNLEVSTRLPDDEADAAGPVPAISRVPLSAVSEIISQHHGPARRFSLHCRRDDGDLCPQVESWLRSRALANLQELDISYAKPPLLTLVLRSASSILVAKISHCDFEPTMSFPFLKKLSLFCVSISVDLFPRLLSGCHALESLSMTKVRAVGCLRFRSPTIRTIIFRHSFGEMAELVIEDAPRLVRLLVPYCERDYSVTIRVIGAPNLEILGPLFVVAPKLQLFQGISPVSSTNSMCSLKVLALKSSGQKLDAVLNILRWFPCLEKLCVIFHVNREMNDENEPQYDPQHPIECLETCLKKVVFKSFEGYGKQVDFAKFFVLNAKVLDKIEFEVRNKYSSETVAYEHRLLQVENRASREARFEFRTTSY